MATYSAAVTAPAKLRATYQDVIDSPENMVAELIDGELYLSPRPKSPHAHAMSILGGLLVPPYGLGRVSELVPATGPRNEARSRLSGRGEAPPTAPGGPTADTKP